MLFLVGGPPFACRAV